MILSLFTGAIATANAASFFLLAPGGALADYIACSSIYSVALWTNIWVLPAATRYNPARLGVLRRAHYAVATTAAAALLATHPNLIGAAFAVAVLAETTMFVSHPLLFESRTLATQRVFFAQTLCATAALLVAVFAFSASPTAYCVVFASFIAALCVAVRAAGVIRAPILPPAGQHGAWALIRDATSSRQLHCMLAARALEIGALLLLAAIHALGAMIAFKLGLAVVNAIITNARRYSAAIIIAVAAAVYATGTAVAIAAAGFLPAHVLPTLHLLTPATVLIGAIPALACLVLNIAGLRAAPKVTD